MKAYELEMPDMSEMRNLGFRRLGTFTKETANKIWDDMPPWCSFFYCPYSWLFSDQVEVWVKE